MPNSTDTSPQEPLRPESNPAFKVRVLPLGRVDDGDLRQAFWRRVFERDELPTEEDIKRAEGRLMRRFPINLIHEALEFRNRDRQYETGRTPLDTPFTFKVDNIAYGSLFFDVSILGITPFLTFFFKNPDIVMAFLDLAVPKAFANAVGNDRLAYDATFYKVYPDAAFEKELDRLRVQSGPQEAGETEEKTGWAGVVQRLAQIPLLLPLVLALAVLYVAVSLENGERDRLKQREEALDIREKDMRAMNDARTAKLEALTLALVSQLRERPASGASAASAASASGASSAMPAK